MIEPSIILSIILGVSLLLFVTEKLPIDMVAFLVLVSLLGTGLVSNTEALSGFANPVTMTIAAMFILSGGLQRTGVVRFIGHHLKPLVGFSNWRMLLVLSITCAFLSAFVNNTAIVAVLLPVTMALCRDRLVNPSKILMPLSFAAQFGGVCTLVGTSTNLLVSEIYKEAGFEPFSMFEFAQLGLICLVVGMVYLVIVGHFFLPERAKSSLEEGYQLNDYLIELKVLEGSKLIDKSFSELTIETFEGSQLVEIIRDKQVLWAPASTAMRENDILVVRGNVSRILEDADSLKLDNWAERKLSEIHQRSSDIELLEVIVPSNSRMVGRTLKDVDFYWRYHAAVLAIKRNGEQLKDRLGQTELAVGDTLLLQGHHEDLEHLNHQRDFMPLKEHPDLRLRSHRAFAAIFIMMSVVAAAAWGFVPIFEASLIGAALMLLTGCLSIQQAYESIDRKVIMLLGGLIPLGAAVSATGMSDDFVQYILTSVGDTDPVHILAAIYGITMVLTAVISNTATAILLAPIALVTAQTLGVDPKPFLVAIAFAASTCFTTPMGYQTNAMVHGPGAYKTLDYLKVGLPLNLIFMAVSIYFIPKFWPF